MIRERLIDIIEKELLRFEVTPGATLLDAIAAFRSEKTVDQARLNIGDLAVWAADAVLADT